MDANSVDAIVCDPPYGLSFMGKDWDHGVPGVHFWTEALRVAKPGAHLVAFGGTRTFHRLAVAIEDAGWELRDTLSWLYGSGFPKSHDVSKAIDKAAGAEREVVGYDEDYAKRNVNGKYGLSISGNDNTQIRAAEKPITAPATPDALRWAGWGTALKPSWEPIILARKPLAERTVAANVLEWGTGAINVDACRVEACNGDYNHPGGHPGGAEPGNGGTMGNGWNNRMTQQPPSSAGRWPPNLLHDGSDEVTACFPVTHGAGHARDASEGTHRGYHDGVTNFSGAPAMRFGDTGSASRFFSALPLDADDVATQRVMYCAKASRSDREQGLEGLEERRPAEVYGNGMNGPTRFDPSLHTAEGVAARASHHVRNHHPTVKPTALMRWLVRLVTPPGGVVLDPFMGSGSTGKAATIEGFDFIGIELEAEYLNIARRRIEAAQLPLLATG
jgi:site-specific DNA-methyltransferase (adenine-specific)